MRDKRGDKRETREIGDRGERGVKYNRERERG